MLVEITDQAGTDGTVVVEDHGVADAIRDWYPADETEVQQAVTDLQSAIDRDDHDMYALAEFLAVTITAATPLTVQLDESPHGYDTTHAAILDTDGEEIGSFGGPISEEWLQTEWDTALVLAGYRRVGAWNVPAGTAPVVAVKSWTLDRSGPEDAVWLRELIAGNSARVEVNDRGRVVLGVDALNVIRTHASSDSDDGFFDVDPAGQVTMYAAGKGYPLRPSDQPS